VSTKLYVGNLPWTFNNNQLSDTFKPHGNVISAKVVTDKESGKSRGFGFVEMVNSDEANKAITALENSDFGGRTLRVNEARPRAPRPPRESNW